MSPNLPIQLNKREGDKNNKMDEHHTGQYLKFSVQLAECRSRLEMNSQNVPSQFLGSKIWKFRETSRGGGQILGNQKYVLARNAKKEKEKNR